MNASVDDTTETFVNEDDVVMDVDEEANPANSLLVLDPSVIQPCQQPANLNNKRVGAHVPINQISNNKDDIMED